MKKLLFIILVFLATVAQGAWGQTASEYHVGQIVGIQPNGWLQTMLQQHFRVDKRHSPYRYGENRQ